MKKAIFSFLTVFMFISILLTGVTETKAAARYLTKDETNLLFFSTLVYSVVDAYPAGTQIKNLNFSSKYLKDFNDSWSDIQSKGYYPKMTIAQFIKKQGLDNWVVYTYLNGKEGLDAYYHGFFGAVFKNTKTNEYVVAFRGTSKIDDWANNLLNVILGIHSHQLPYAEKLLAKVPKNANVTLTGHSLGGYMASYLTLTKGVKGVTFNAPGFTGKYLTAVQNSPYKSRLTHHTMDHDDLVGKRYTKYGTQYFYIKKDAKLLTPVSSWHSVKNFYQYAAR